MADNRLAGVASITIDGKAYSIVGEGTYRVSSSTRDALKGQDGIHGFKEMAETGRISWTGRDSGSLSMTDLNAATGVTVVLTSANGKVIIGSKMWRSGDPAEVNTEEGTFQVVFESDDVSEN